MGQSNVFIISISFRSSSISWPSAYTHFTATNVSVLLCFALKTDPYFLKTVPVQKLISILEKNKQIFFGKNPQFQLETEITLVRFALKWCILCQNFRYLRPNPTHLSLVERLQHANYYNRPKNTCHPKINANLNAKWLPSLVRCDYLFFFEFLAFSFQVTLNSIPNFSWNFLGPN